MSYRPEGYANASMWGEPLQIDGWRVTVGQRAWDGPDGDGWLQTTGEIQTDSGHRFWAVLLLDVSSSGEHWATYIPATGRIVEPGQQDSLQALRLTNEQVFPYRYRYDATIPRDLHIGPDGWSR